MRGRNHFQQTRATLEELAASNPDNNPWGEWDSIEDPIYTYQSPQHSGESDIGSSVEDIDLLKDVCSARCELTNRL